MFYLSLASVFALFLLGGCSAPSTPSTSRDYGDHDFACESVSIIQLIGDPSSHHGKKVLVKGVIQLEFEGNALYLSKDDRAFGISKNAVWISLDEAKIGISTEGLARLNGRYVLVEGTFDKSDTGHMGLFAGAIHKITRVRDWERVP